eukprot:21138-Heterococcus_DN1.PRE.4
MADAARDSTPRTLRCIGKRYSAPTAFRSSSASCSLLCSCNTMHSSLALLILLGGASLLCSGFHAAGFSLSKAAAAAHSSHFHHASKAASAADLLFLTRAVRVPSSCNLHTRSWRATALRSSAMSSYGASASTEKAAALEPVIDKTQQEIAALRKEINEAYRHYFHKEHLGMRGQELQDYVHKLEDTLRSKTST